MSAVDQRQVFLCDAVRTPIGRFGGALATVIGFLDELEGESR